MCQGCHLGEVKKKKTGVDEFGAQDYCDVYTPCSTNENKYSVANKVIAYWINDDGEICTDIPLELSNLLFTEKQLIWLEGSHMNLVHLKNGNLGSTGNVFA